MRIITGAHKGKIIKARFTQIKPTTDYAKSGLFNYLSNLFDLTQVTVLDLCAGTGNISYEFAARGAKSVVAVDNDLNCLKFIRKTAEELSFSSIMTVRSDILRFLTHCDHSYDLIFADPPYEYIYYEALHQSVMGRSLLKKNGILIIEHSGKNKFLSLNGFKEERYYGNVHFSYFRE